MKFFATTAVLAAGLFGIAGSAMADKTWNSDPAPNWPARTQSTIEVVPAPAEPSYAPSKAYKLYKAPKAKAKSQVKAR